MTSTIDRYGSVSHYGNINVHFFLGKRFFFFNLAAFVSWLRLKIEEILILNK